MIDPVVARSRLGPDLGHLAASRIVAANKCQVRISSILKPDDNSRCYLVKEHLSGCMDAIQIIGDLADIRTEGFEYRCMG